jgi:signal transduction histidine kinase/ABC-type uncharacterized transport system substrate-binding protein
MQSSINVIYGVPTTLFNLMRKILSLIFVVIAILFLIFLFFKKYYNTKEISSAVTKEVIFVSSYHDNQSWTVDVRNSMLNEFSNGPFQINMHNIYLHSKSITSFAERKKILKANIEPIRDKVDIIVASDLEATEQMMDYITSDSIKSPVVMLSEHSYNEKNENNNIYSIVTETGIRSTFEFALKTFPHAKKVYVWSDKTITGNYYMDLAKRELEPFKDSLEIDFGIAASSDSVFLEKASKLMANSFVIFCTWQVDDNGKEYDAQLFYPKLISKTNVPVFTVISNVMDCGFLGGYVLSPVNNGRSAAKYVEKILKGESVSHVEYIPPVPVFNKRAMKYWNVEQELLPKNSRILFSVGTLFKDNLLWIVGLLIVIFIALLIIGILWHFEKRIEKQYAELEEYKNNLDIALEAGSVSVWLYDYEKEVYHQLRGDMICGVNIMNDKELKNIFHPDDYINYSEILATLKRGDLERAEAVFRCFNKDGTYHYIESKMIANRDKYGKVVTLTGTQKDVTKIYLYRKEMSTMFNKLKFAIQTANMVIWEYDSIKRYFITYNDPIADYKDNAIIYLEDYIKYMHPQDILSEQTSNSLRVFNNMLDESFTFNLRLKSSRDLEWQHCTILGLPMEKGSAGKVTRYMGIRVNNTEMIKYQIKLEEEVEKALAADKLKSIFLANMSHEIRTPLNAIVGFSNMMLSAETPEERSEYVDIINQNKDLLIRLISDILDLSKIEAGIVDFKPERIDWSVIFNDTYKSSKARYISPKVKFLQSNPYKSCIINFDKDRLVQIITNFITNAIKYTLSGHILMGYEIVDSGLRLYVEDTGIGIAAEKQTKVFDRFEKLDSFVQGTGLGLAICKAIVEIQGGRIGVESKEGEGSTFWAWLPCDAEIS